MGVWWAVGLWGSIALGADARQTEVLLDRTATTLHRAARRPGPEALGALPSWVDLSFAGRASDRGDQAALARALSRGSPTRRALAARWLASSQDPTAIAALETALDDRAEAGWFPQQGPGSDPAATGPDWTSPTVGAIALLGLEQLVGQRFESEADYRRWREAHSDPAGAPEVWLHALQSDPEPDKTLSALPDELALRVRWLRGDLPDDALREQWRAAVGPERTSRLLRGTERWSEHEDEAVFARFCRWAVFELDPAELASLWAQDGLREGAACRTSLAVALGRAEPSRREALLVEALAEPGSGPVREALYELARHHATSQHALLARYLSMPDGTHLATEARTAIFQALADGGWGRRQVLVALLEASDFQSTDGRVVSALARAARVAGMEVPACDGPFELQPLLGQQPSVELSTDLLIQRQRCVTELRRAK